MRVAFGALLGLLGLAVSTALAEEAVLPVEYGTVRWQRDYDTAQRLALVEDQPILLFFQEVPG